MQQLWYLKKLKRRWLELPFKYDWGTNLQRTLKYPSGRLKSALIDAACVYMRDAYHSLDAYN